MGGRAGGGASGGMGSGVRASAPVAAAKTQTQSQAKVSIPSMPGKYQSATFSINGEKYTISHVPTGYGKQQKTNGRFTLTKPNGDYQDFKYGDFYGGYSSKSAAYKQLKSWVNKYYIK